VIGGNRPPVSTPNAGGSSGMGDLWPSCSATPKVLEQVKMPAQDLIEWTRTKWPFEIASKCLHPFLQFGIHRN